MDFIYVAHKQTVKTQYLFYRFCEKHDHYNNVHVATKLYLRRKIGRLKLRL